MSEPIHEWHCVMCGGVITDVSMRNHISIICQSCKFTNNSLYKWMKFRRILVKYNQIPERPRIELNALK